ncbi:FadR/GntR family transcriptional regulator [Pseudactinotalea sp. HY158]|uniref:FadR/GntR family transcriptional regulator n=1 Tax=Pseudactinotalea sp. HY158 TaxID=2654547 RepID=UPI00129D07CF|nr:FCD domain-containing protein [Pseudactinotalea sp. HY158]QGH69727.1 FCD domain-containing protein [Pseudactinotalea sp. HY158]
MVTNGDDVRQANEIAPLLSDNIEEGGLNRSLFARVARLLRSRGIRGGDALPTEASLARDLGVGRPQLREALSALEAIGVVRSRQGARRVWVDFDLGRFSMRALSILAPDDAVARDLLEVRHALETSLLPRAVQFLDRVQRAELRELAAEMLSLAKGGQSFSSIDMAFHRQLFSPLNNSVLNGVLESFWAVFDEIRPPSETVVEDPEIAAMHGYILDAIEEGDMRRAVHELDAHFYGVRNRFPDMTFSSHEAAVRSQ